MMKYNRDNKTGICGDFNNKNLINPQITQIFTDYGTRCKRQDVRGKKESCFLFLASDLYFLLNLRIYNFLYIKI